MIARGAAVAALYAGVTLIFEPISFGPVQLRVSEALTLLPLLWVDAVPGLFVGCLIANLFGGLGLVDIICGSAATLTAALLTRLAVPNVLLGAAAPVAVNGVVVGIYLSFITDMPVYLTIPYVAAGEAMACFALGIPLIRELRKRFGEKDK
ncbi:transporter [Synergistales bacterium]|nr:transporter [Synergistales bacterium]